MPLTDTVVRLAKPARRGNSLKLTRRVQWDLKAFEGRPESLVLLDRKGLLDPKESQNRKDPHRNSAGECAVHRKRPPRRLLPAARVSVMPPSALTLMTSASVVALPAFSRLCDSIRD